MEDVDAFTDIGDSWIDKLEQDLRAVENVSRSADKSRALRAEMISAKGRDFFESIIKQAKKAAHRLGFEFDSDPTSFVVTRRMPSFARLHATLDTTAQAIKVTCTRAGKSRAIEKKASIDIRLDNEDDLYLEIDGKRRLISEALNRMFRTAFLPDEPIKS